MFHVDHAALLYLVEKQALTGKLARWMLLLQEFEFTIQHRPGTQRAIADYLSKLGNGNNAIMRDDDFPVADILRVAAIATQDEKSFPDRWPMEMTYFLTTGLPPPQLRMDEKKRLTVQSHNFFLVAGVLYHKGSDGIWSCGIRQEEKEAVLREAHCGTVGGHYVLGDKSLRMGREKNKESG